MFRPIGTWKRSSRSQSTTFDITLKANATSHLRPDPPDRGLQQRPHLLLSQLVLDGEQPVRDEIVAGDQLQVRVGGADVDLDEGGVGELRRA